MQAAQPLLMMLVMFGIFYFILIRPQMRKQKEMQAMLGKLGKGDTWISGRSEAQILRNSVRARLAARVGIRATPRQVLRWRT